MSKEDILSVLVAMCLLLAGAIMVLLFEERPRAIEIDPLALVELA